MSHSQHGYGLGVVHVFALVLAVGAVQSAIALADSPDSVGQIHFKAPPDWRPVDQPGKTMRMYVAPDSTPAEQAVLIIAFGQSGGEFRTQFDGFVKGAMTSRKIVQSGQVRPGRSRQGFPVLTQNLTSEDSAGRLAMARFVAADINGQPALLCYVATLPDAYEGHHAAAEQFMASVSFGDSAPAPSQDSGGPAPAAPAAPPAQAPAADAPAAPATSPEQWARDAAARRKPHTILGNILNSQGKPVQGVKGIVYVGGTTLRGDRTSFDLDVDENGHFEMLVPDGVYRLTPNLTADYDGQRLPVQLEPMDGKNPAQTFGSAEGIVRDFRWVLLGRRPGVDGDSYVNYFGAHITLQDASPGGPGRQLKDRYPPGTKLRIVFTPKGPLLDGSEGRPMLLEVDVKVPSGFANQGCGTIPIGVYTASAELVAPNGRRGRLAISQQLGDPPRAQDLEIHPKPGDTLGDVKDITLWITDGAG